MEPLSDRGDNFYKNGSPDTWDYSWVLTCLINNALIAIPNNNLINNIGFNSDYNEVTIHYNDLKKNKETLSHKKKSEISEEIVDRIVTHMN